jgi:hypothetical protein
MRFSLRHGPHTRLSPHCTVTGVKTQTFWERWVKPLKNQTSGSKVMSNSNLCPKLPQKKDLELSVWVYFSKLVFGSVEQILFSFGFILGYGVNKFELLITFAPLVQFPRFPK